MITPREPSCKALRGKGDLGFRGVGKRVGDQRAGERRQSGAGQWGVVRGNANRLAPTSRHYSDIFMPPASTVLWIGYNVSLLCMCLYIKPLFAQYF